MITVSDVTGNAQYDTYDAYAESPRLDNVCEHLAWIPDVLPGIRPMFIVFAITSKGTILEDPKGVADPEPIDLPCYKVLAVYDYIDVVNFTLAPNLWSSFSDRVREKIIPTTLDQHLEETAEYYSDYPEYWDVEIKGPEHDWMAPETPWERDN